MESTKIIEEVRKDIEQKGLIDDAPSYFDVENSGMNISFNRQMFYERIYSMDAVKNDNWYFDLQGNAIKVCIQKIVRKLNAFILTKVFNNQNSFNSQTVAAMFEVAGYINLCEKRISNLEKEIERLNAELEK